MQSAPRVINTLQVRGDELRPYDLITVSQFEWQVYAAPDKHGIAVLRDPEEQPFRPERKRRVRKQFLPDELYEVRRSMPVPRTLSTLKPAPVAPLVPVPAEPAAPCVPVPAVFKSRPAEDAHKGDLIVWDDVTYRVAGRQKYKESILLKFTVEPVNGGRLTVVNLYPRNWIPVSKNVEASR